jgi:predicted  nucleic acid-binding Zn-ribbon protein
VTTQAIIEAKARETIKLMGELQEIDDELRDIALERGDLPEEVEKLTTQISELEAFILQRKTDLSGSESELAQRQQTLAEARDRHTKYQQQLYSVKTTREYDAITAEFNFVKDEIQVSEQAIERETKRTVDLTRTLEDRVSQLERVRSERKVKHAELEEKLAETAGDEQTLQSKRKAVVAQIHGPLYAHYERIRQQKDGRGVARMLDGACGGCFAMIPPQIQQNIRQMNDIVMCETCGRYLCP